MNRIIKGLLLFSLAMILLFLGAGGCSTYRSLGHKPSGKELSVIARLPNYRNHEFQNIDSSGVDFNEVSWTKLLGSMFNKPKNRRPGNEMITMETNLNSVVEKPTVIWFGHSSFLIKTASANILVDPDFSGYAGPNSWFVKAFEGSDAYSIEDLPPIDVLLISHDHYDHLDYETVKKLRNKVKHVIVPIGIGAHFRYWNYADSQIHELNWNESYALSDLLKITVTPARHESGRTLASMKTLWGSFVIEADGFKLFYSGDSAYGRHFKQIGNRYGPFDLALMECGQYDKMWPRNHMFPEQTVSAAKDLNAKIILPVHWGKFAEANHPWNESVNRLLVEASIQQIPVTIPRLGEAYTIGNPPFKDEWFNP